MKIIAIRGANLASIDGEFDIDFTREPLKSAGIFAITGKTGAGKSTILDALCLALYRKTPRTTDNEATKLLDAGKLINQNDPRNILRRGCGSGYAEVEFEALDAAHYRSRYTIRRARNNPNSSLQGSDFQVYKINSLNEEEALSGNQTDLQKEIIRLTGLTFQQFTRAVLLAQGDFATFLKAKDEERAELLEKLTGTEIYSKISQKIFNNYNSAKQEYELFSSGLQAIKEQILPEELFAQYTNECAEIQKNVKNFEAEKKINELHLQWLQRSDELQKGLASAKENNENAQKAIIDANARVLFLQKYDDVQVIANQYNVVVNCKKEIKQLQKEEQLKKDLDNSLKKSQEEVAKQESAISEEVDNVQKEIKGLQPKLDEAKKLDALLEEKSKNLTDAEQDTKTAQENYNTIFAELQTQQTQVEKLQELEKTLKQWFEEHSSKRHLADYSTVIVQKISTYKDAITNLRDSEKQLEDAQNENEKSLEQHKSITQEWQKYTESCSLEVLKLRQQLQQGKPCEVCGSIVTHIPHEEVNAEFSYEELLQRSENCKIKLDNLAKNLVVLNEKIKQFGNQRLKNYDECEKQKGALADDLQSYTTWEADFENDTIIQKIEKFAKLWKEYEKQLQDLKLSEAQLQQENLQKQEKEKREILLDIKSKEKLAIESYNELKTKRKSLFNNASVSTVEYEWSEKLKEVTKRREKILERKSEVQKAISTNQGELQNIGNQHSERETQLQNAQTQIQIWLQNQSNIRAEELPMFFEKSPEWITQERNKVQQLYTEKTKTETAVNLAQNDIEAHKKTQSKDIQIIDKEKLEELILTFSKKIEQSNERYVELNTELSKHNDATQKIKNHSKELFEKETNMNLWQKLSSVFGSADGAKFKRLAQAFTLEALLDDANYYLQLLSNRYRLGRIGDTLTLQVEDLDMGGEIRSVHSLSGGESFLVSLALALGLSSLASDRLSIHSLFIDEGFGSLDAETLTCAMNALERLQATGRKVGVISHVSEMSERIACKIHVQKMGNGKSSVTINSI